MRQGGPFVHALRRVSELRTLSLATLKTLQAQLKTDLEEIEKVIISQARFGKGDVYSKENCDLYAHFL